MLGPLETQHKKLIQNKELNCNMLKKASILITLFLLGCATMNSKNDQFIEIGMLRSNVLKITECIEEIQLMTDPSQFSRACKIRKNEVDYIVAFDNNDHTIVISTNSTKFRLPNGIGVGDTFSKIKRSYNNYHIKPSLGFGRFVVVQDGVHTFGFSWILRSKNDSRSDFERNSKIDDNEKIEWIELEKI